MFVSVGAGGLVGAWVAGAIFSVGCDAGVSAGWLPQAEISPTIKMKINTLVNFMKGVLLETI
jgi:hypothetical protein